MPIIILIIFNINSQVNMANFFSDQGIEYFKLNNYEVALEYLDKAIRSGTKDEKCFYYRGLINLKYNKENEAIKDFYRTIELNPKFIPPYIQLGNLYQTKESYELALDIYMKLVRNYPNNSLSYSNRGYFKLSW